MPDPESKRRRFQFSLRLLPVAVAGMVPAAVRRAAIPGIVAPGTAEPATYS